MEERGRYHPGTEGDNTHGQPLVVEDRWLVDERELRNRLQRFVVHVVKRRYSGTRDDDLTDKKYEVGHLRTDRLS